MKKTLIPVLVTVCVLVAMKWVHNRDTEEAPKIVTGDEYTFELEYQGSTGESENLTYAGYVFSGAEEADSSFIASVREQAGNEVRVAHNPFLIDRPHSAIEHKDNQILNAYFDLNADGKLSEDEKMTPSDIPEAQRNGAGTVAFLTPDFVVSHQDGQKSMFRLILMSRFLGDSLLVTWTTMGSYQGVAKIGDEEMRLTLYPDFSSRRYTQYAKSRYVLGLASDEKPQLNAGRMLSSLILHNGTFYRVNIKDSDLAKQTITVAVAEDRSPRGKFSFDIQGKEELQYQLGGISVRGGQGNSISLGLRDEVNELPVGEYWVSSGRLSYGDGEIKDHMATFQNSSTFSVEEGVTTIVKLGEIQGKVRAVKLANRYSGEKEYKTEFKQGDDIFLDIVFEGIAKETYGSFSRRIKDDKYSRSKTYNGSLKILDAGNNEVASGEMEYG